MIRLLSPPAARIVALHRKRLRREQQNDNKLPSLKTLRFDTVSK
jgi:hypothetical protein